MLSLFVHKDLYWNLWSRKILQHCLLDQVQHSCLESWIKGWCWSRFWCWCWSWCWTRLWNQSDSQGEQAGRSQSWEPTPFLAQLSWWYHQIIIFMKNYAPERFSDGNIQNIEKTSKICNIRTSGGARCYFSPQKCSRWKVGEVGPVTFLSNVVNVLLLVWKSWNVRYNHCASDIQLTLWQFFCTGSPFHCLQKYTTRLAIETIKWKKHVFCLKLLHFQQILFKTNILCAFL